jgi:hypothetical protein
VRISRPDPDLYQIHLRHDGRDIVFLANQSADRAIAFALDVRGSQGVPWRWDPEKGERHLLPGGKTAPGYPLALEPLESALLVFETGGRAESPAAGRIAASEPVPFASPWHLAFHPRFGAAFELDLPAPLDLGASPDPRLNAFAGTVDYSAAFDLPAGEFALDLGKVEGVTEASLNGIPLGIRWYGRHRYALAGAARPGRNELRIRFTSTLFNYCRTRGDVNPDVKFWLRSGTDPAASGIMGPVRLYRVSGGGS